MLSKSRRVLDLRELGLVAGAAVILGLLWNTPLIAPLKFFSVLIHECSHAIAAILTGGSVDKIDLRQNATSLTFVHGGIPFIFGSAGYLGSVTFGCLFLYLSRFERTTRYWCLAVGLMLSMMTLSFVSLLHDPFGFIYGSVAGLVIALVGWKFEEVSHYFMKFLGVAVCLFAFMDIQYNLVNGFDRLNGSDAGILAASTGIPAVIWAALWIGFATVMLAVFGYLSATVKVSAVAPGSVVKPGSSLVRSRRPRPTATRPAPLPLATRPAIRTASRTAMRKQVVSRGSAKMGASTTKTGAGLRK